MSQYFLQIHYTPFSQSIAEEVIWSAVCTLAFVLLVLRYMSIFEIHVSWGLLPYISLSANISQSVESRTREHNVLGHYRLWVQSFDWQTKITDSL